MSFVADDGDPVVAPSARKHGVDDTDSVHAFHHAMRAWDLGGGFVMLLGGDRAGNLLEIGVVQGDAAKVIVHAMPARKKFLR